MEFDEIKMAIKNLNEQEQRRVVLELLPEIWPKIVTDDNCIKLLRKLIDEESIKEYLEEHMNHF
jgi:hypothetical protein